MSINDIRPPGSIDRTTTRTFEFQNLNSSVSWDLDNGTEVNHSIFQPSAFSMDNFEGTPSAFVLKTKRHDERITPPSEAEKQRRGTSQRVNLFGATSDTHQEHNGIGPSVDHLTSEHYSDLSPSLPHDPFTSDIADVELSSTPRRRFESPLEMFPEMPPSLTDAEFPENLPIGPTQFYKFSNLNGHQLAKKREEFAFPQESMEPSGRISPHKLALLTPSSPHRHNPPPSLAGLIPPHHHSPSPMLIRTSTPSPSFGTMTPTRGTPPHRQTSSPPHHQSSPRHQPSQPSPRGQQSPHHRVPSPHTIPSPRHPASPHQHPPSPHQLRPVTLPSSPHLQHSPHQHPHPHQTHPQSPSHPASPFPLPALSPHRPPSPHQYPSSPIGQTSSPSPSFPTSHSSVGLSHDGLTGSTSSSPPSPSLEQIGSYKLAAWPDIFGRCKEVLKRDNIRQKTMAADIGLSGSTLSPMLRGKYRHTKEQHINMLRQWACQRDKRLQNKLLQQAATLNLSNEALAPLLGVPVPTLVSWVDFSMPVTERSRVDILVMKWLKSFQARDTPPRRRRSRGPTKVGTPPSQTQGDKTPSSLPSQGQPTDPLATPPSFPSLPSPALQSQFSSIQLSPQKRAPPLTGLDVHWSPSKQQQQQLQQQQQQLQQQQHHQQDIKMTPTLVHQSQPEVEKQHYPKRKRPSPSSGSYDKEDEEDEEEEEDVDDLGVLPPLLSVNQTHSSPEIYSHSTLLSPHHLHNSQHPSPPSPPLPSSSSMSSSLPNFQQVGSDSSLLPSYPQYHNSNGWPPPPSQFFSSSHMLSPSLSSLSSAGLSPSLSSLHGPVFSPLTSLSGSTDLLSSDLGGSLSALSPSSLTSLFSNVSPL